VKYDQKLLLGFMYSIRYYCQIFKKLEFSRQIFEKYSKVEFCDNHFSGGGDVPRGQTDVSKQIVTFCNLCTRLTPASTKNYRIMLVIKAYRNKQSI
jgi:hypothetical protein